MEYDGLRKEMPKNDGRCHFGLFYKQIENVKMIFRVENNPGE
jgi:hypothetical protein